MELEGILNIGWRTARFNHAEGSFTRHNGADIMDGILALKKK